MKKIIHHLRNKPEEERRHLLHFIMIILSFLMIIVWSYSLGNTFNDPDTKEKLKEDIKPFSVLKESLTNEVQNISNTSLKSGNSNTQ